MIADASWSPISYRRNSFGKNQIDEILFSKSPFNVTATKLEIFLWLQNFSCQKFLKTLYLVNAKWCRVFSIFCLPDPISIKYCKPVWLACLLNILMHLTMILRQLPDWLLISICGNTYYKYSQWKYLEPSLSINLVLPRYSYHYDATLNINGLFLPIIFSDIALSSMLKKSHHHCSTFIVTILIFHVTQRRKSNHTHYICFFCASTLKLVSIYMAIHAKMC